MTEPLAKRGKTVESILFLSSSSALPPWTQHHPQHHPQQQQHHHRHHCTSTHMNQSSASANNHEGLLLLPEDVLCRMTSFLDARSLLQFGAVNKYYHRLAQENQAGWDNLCRALWKTKVHVCPKAVAHLQNSGNNHAAKEAYQMAWYDAHQRNFVLPAEFCYHPDTGQGTIWSFRFKESAGADWTSIDPWYQGGPCRQMVFLPDGCVQQYLAHAEGNNNTTSAADQPIGAFEEPATDTINDHHHDSGAATGRNRTRLAAGAILVDPPVTMSWRFLTRPMDLPTRPWGSYVRFNVAGRDVPTYSVRRSPTNNWGFLMESCWGLYASFPLPPRKKRWLRRTPDDVGVTWVDEDGVVDQGIGVARHHQHDFRGMHLERNQLQMNLPYRHHRHDSMDADMPSGDQQPPHGSMKLHGPPRRVLEPLQDDSCLFITNEVQWREAFLYNVGARILPEGDEATNEFDRAWGGL